MKKYIALLLAGLMLSMAACSSETPEETETETSAPETVAEAEEVETEPETKIERPEDETVINYITLELEKDAIYDRDAGVIVMYFANHQIWYEADTKCSIGLISDEEAFSISGTPDMTAYPDVIVDDDDYCGIAIKVDEEISAGTYFVSVTFDEYIVNFDFTVE